LTSNDIFIHNFSMIESFTSFGNRPKSSIFPIPKPASIQVEEYKYPFR
jgi:hypothetical protein